MEILHSMVELKYSSAVSGEQCVTVGGTFKVPEWFVASWDSTGQRQFVHGQRLEKGKE